MKPWIPGAASAALIFFLFPSRQPLSQQWSKALDAHLVQGISSDSAAPIAPELLHDQLVVAGDSLAIPADPFGLPPEPIQASGPAVAVGPAIPAPARPWSATGRVGERAAVLTSTDGRILVVSSGSRVDSSVVVSIGNGGIVLEDRAGRFVLQIP